MRSTTREKPSLPQLQKNPHSNDDPAQPKIKKQNYFLKILNKGPLLQGSSRKGSLLPCLLTDPLSRRRAQAYPADGGLVGCPDFLALGRAAIGQDVDDGIFICAWWRGDRDGVRFEQGMRKWVPLRTHNPNTHTELSKPRSSYSECLSILKGNRH